MTKAEFSTEVKFRSMHALTGVSNTEIDYFTDSALREYSRYRPEIVVLADNAVNATGFYNLPNNVIDILRVVDRNDRQIRFSVEQDAYTNLKKLKLGRIEQPSYGHLLHQNYYDDPANQSYSSGVYSSDLYPTNSSFSYQGSSSYGFDSYKSFDIIFSRRVDIERVEDFAINDLMLWVEHLGYLLKAGDPKNIVDITDREPSGASTTIKNSTRSNTYMKLSDTKREQFRKNVILPYGVRDQLPTIRLLNTPLIRGTVSDTPSTAPAGQISQTVESNVLRISGLNQTPVSFTTEIPNIQIYEGTRIEFDLSPYVTEDGRMLDFEIELFQDVDGTIPLQMSNPLSGFAQIDDIREVLILNLLNVDLPTNIEIFARITIEF